ncbi:MAG: signal recognition particle receptor subunit alpha, partial [Solobacterium sp.]|nr:signal recognition particle receptor subunit alpha [Solobacterium sp.]
MAFDSLSERLSKTLRDVSGKGRLTDKNMEDMLKEVRIALLEADVNYKIVKEFLEDIRQRARGEDVLNGVEPGQMLVKIVHDEIIELLGTEQAGLNFKEDQSCDLLIRDVRAGADPEELGEVNIG